MTKPLHAINPQEAMQELNVTEKGLSTQEAQQRLTQYGTNELNNRKTSFPHQTLPRTIHRHPHDYSTIATGLSIAIGEEIDALIIFAIVSLRQLWGLLRNFAAKRLLTPSKKWLPPAHCFA